jgi:hypothetical protein
MTHQTVTITWLSRAARNETRGRSGAPPRSADRQAERYGTVLVTWNTCTQLALGWPFASSAQPTPW